MGVTDLFSKLRLIFPDPDEPGEVEVGCVCGGGEGWRGREDTPLLMASGSDFCESLNSSESTLLGKQWAGNRILDRKTGIPSSGSAVSLGKFLNSSVLLITCKTHEPGGRDC